MKPALAAFALLALVSLVAVSVWASGHIGILTSLADLRANPAQGNNPWFWATLLDGYFAFLWFWIWVAWRETSWGVRLVWLVLILALGNMAMAAYVLIELVRLPAGATLDALFRRKGAAA